MKITATSQTNIKSNFIQKYKSNPFKNTSFDSVSFTGQEEKRESHPGISPMRVFVATTGFLTVLSQIFQMMAVPVKASSSEEDVSRAQEAQDALLALGVNGQNLKENRDFQLRQTLDCPSLTFDFSDNCQIESYKPFASSVFLTSNPDKNSLDEFDNLVALIEENYGVNPSQAQLFTLIAQGILKNNTWMLSKITPNETDWTDGDVTNVTPGLIFATDYVSDLDAPIRVYCPEINAISDKNTNSKAQAVASTEFIPIDADSNNLYVLELGEDDFKNANSAWSIINVIENNLAERYAIPDMDSYAGAAIWHGIGIYEDNYEIFEGVNEENLKNAAARYVEDNGSITLVLPKVGVTIIDKEGTSPDDAIDALLASTNQDIKIGYLSVDSEVLDLSETQGCFRPIDILGLVRFEDGTSLKELYESNNEKYAPYAIIALRQLFDNNNLLSGIDLIEEEDLYETFDLHDFDSSLKSEDEKINMQPVAIVFKKVRFQQPPKNEEPTTPSSEPSDPSKPSDPSEPSDPSDPSDPSKPSDPTECPDLPGVDKPDHNLDPSKPTLPDRPSEPTGPSKPTDPTDPYCPTEPSQPNTDKEDPDMRDDVVDFEEAPSEPSVTPSETPDTPSEPSVAPSEPDITVPDEKPTECPVEPEIPPSNNDGNDASDFEAGFGDEIEDGPKETLSADDQKPTTPSEDDETTGSAGSNDNNDVNDFEAGFGDEDYEEVPGDDDDAPAILPTVPPTLDEILGSNDNNNVNDFEAGLESGDGGDDDDVIVVPGDEDGGKTPPVSDETIGSNDNNNINDFEADFSESSTGQDSTTTLPETPNTQEPAPAAPETGMPSTNNDFLEIIDDIVEFE